MGDGTEEQLRAIRESLECMIELQKEMLGLPRSGQDKGKGRGRPTETINLLQEKIGEARIKEAILSHKSECLPEIEKSREKAFDRFIDKRIFPLARDLDDLEKRVDAIADKTEVTANVLLDGEKTRQTMGTIGQQVSEIRRRIFGYTNDQGSRLPGLIERAEKIEFWAKRQEKKAEEEKQSEREATRTSRYYFGVALKIAAILLPLIVSSLALLSARGMI